MSSRTAFIAAIVVLLIVAGGAFNYLTGHPLLCDCGRLWYGNADGPLNSQTPLDWYTPSHVIHGLAFYWVAWQLLRGHSGEVRFLAAVAAEVAWEVVENTALVVNLYRPPITADRFGDTVINSTADIVAMMAGYWLASRLPTWASLTMVVAIWVIVGYWIRHDLGINLT